MLPVRYRNFLNGNNFIVPNKSLSDCAEIACAYRVLVFTPVPLCSDQWRSLLGEVSDVVYVVFAFG